MQINFGTGLVIQGITPATDFSASVAPTTRAVDALNVNVAQHDLLINLDISAYTANCQQITVVDSPIAPGHSFSSENPSIATADSSGLVMQAQLIPGTPVLVPVDVVTAIGTRAYPCIVSATGKTINTKSITYAAGSLGAHIYDNIKAAFSGKTPGDGTTAWISSSNGNVDAPAVTLNAGRWATAGQEAISVMRAGMGSSAEFPAMLVSDRHFLIANHIAPTFVVGGKIVWKDHLGGYQVSTLSAAPVQVGSTDIAVGYLSSPIAVVTPFKILPSDYLKYLPEPSGSYPSGYPLPAYMKSERGLTDNGGDWIKTIGLIGVATYGIPTNAEMAQWNTSVNIPVDSGDSGSPVFALINGQAVLLSAPFHATDGSNYAANAAAIESVMTAQAGVPYALSRVDLTGFNTY